MNVELLSLWPTKIYHTVAELENERNWLLAKLEYLKSQDNPNTAGSNGNTTRNGYQPKYDFFQDSSEEMESIYENLISPLSYSFWSELAEGHIDIPANYKLVHKAWLVEYHPGTWQDLHNHKNSLFTGVWTIYNEGQMSGHGEFQIHNPSDVSHNAGFLTAVKKVQTNLNDVYLLPGWIYHNVTPTSSRRIVFVWDSIALPDNR